MSGWTFRLLLLPVTVTGVTAQRVYLSIGYDRYHEQQKAVTQRLGVYGSVLRSFTNAMTSVGNGGTAPSRVG